MDIHFRKSIEAEVTEKVTALVKECLDNLEKSAADSKYHIPTMLQIESLWDGLENATNQVYAEIMTKIVSNINEKEIIKLKK